VHTANKQLKLQLHQHMSQELYKTQSDWANLSPQQAAATPATNQRLLLSPQQHPTIIN
jgi:hypothetical protein